MIKHLGFCLFMLLGMSSGFAQAFAHTEYDWAEKPAITKTDRDSSEALEVVLKEKMIVEFYYDPGFNNALLEYFTWHKKIKVNSSNAIQRNNKVYISMNRAIELIDAKARVIKPNGEVTEFNKENIKDVSDLEAQGAYKFFAIEGAELGSEIEFLYTTKRIPSYSGRRISFQKDVPVEAAGFELYAPKNLRFGFKSYNGLTEVLPDTTDKKRMVYKMADTRIEALDEEKYAPYQRSLMRLEFKLDENVSTSSNAVTSYAKAAQSIYQNLHPKLSKSDLKRVKKLSKELKLNGSEEEKVRKIESYIKRNIAVYESLGEDYLEIPRILDDKITNQNGLMTLFMAMFKEHNIKYKVVLTCDRNEALFDKDFESYANLQEYFFYFPDMDKFLAPGEELFRLGFVPAEYSNNYGLFIEEVSIGDLQTGLGSVEYIPASEYLENQDNLTLKMKMSDDKTSIEMDVTREMTGLSASFLQGAFKLIPEESQREVGESLLKASEGEDEMLSFSAENIDEEDIMVNPMILSGKVKANSLLEKAGPNYIFKIGLSIGSQVEMYQEKKRVLPIENSYNHMYDRRLEFEIPEGYTIKNPKDLNMDIFYEVDGERRMTFTSTYTLEGNLLKVKVIEYYRDISYPLETHANFIKVINAAADFNKIVLVLEKE